MQLSKRDPIKDPRAGDWWERGTEHEVSDFDGEFVSLDSFDGQWLWPLPTFARWAAGATFIGGAE